MIESLIPKSEFIGLEGFANLCAGGESPMLASHRQAIEQFMLDKSRGEEARHLEAEMVDHLPIGNPRIREHVRLVLEADHGTIGDEPIDTLGVTEAVTRLRGAEGTSVELLIWRDGREERIAVERAVIDVDESGWR